MKLQPSSFTQSDALWARAKDLIPAGTQTFSKGPKQFVQGVSPKYLQRGKGSHVWDVDGNEYIDYPMGLGPVILGHAHPVINAAVVAQIAEGSTFTHMHPLEVEVAELLRDLVPHVEMVRFGKNGSDATTGAVRCARANTKRDKIVSCGYHSWHDWYVAGTSRSEGVPNFNHDLIIRFPYNNIDALHAIFKANPNDIALVIMEPVVFEAPKDGFLGEVIELAHRYGALVCMDEIITGFRLHMGGACAHFGVMPDLSTYGKAISNGFPLSAIGGKAEYMQIFDEVFMSGTYGGEVISLAASKATLNFMQENPVIPHLWAMGERLQTGFNSLVAGLGLGDYVACVGLHPRTSIQFQDPKGKIAPLHLKSLFQQEVVKRGIIFNGNHMLTYSHSAEDIDYTLEAYQAALEVFAKFLDSDDNIFDWLEGAPIEPVFR